MHEKLALDRPDAEVRRKQTHKGDGAADDQRGRNTDRARHVLPYSAEAAVVLAATGDAVQDRWTERCL